MVRSRGEDQSLCLDYAPVAVHLGSEVGIVLTVLTVDEALQHMCRLFREQADRGSITPSERDLLIDGAVLLAMRVDDLARDDRGDPDPGWPEWPLQKPAGRHERQMAHAA